MFIINIIIINIKLILKSYFMFYRNFANKSFTQMSTTNLPPNHLRSVSASIYLIEKTIDELETMLTQSKPHFSYETVNDIDDSEKEKLLQSIKQTRAFIAELMRKYSLNREVTYMSRILNARKSRMWEILGDTTSKRMKGYGKLPCETATELDQDINKLTGLIGLL